jgi:hypothetical protein
MMLMIFEKKKHGPIRCSQHQKNRFSEHVLNLFLIFLHCLCSFHPFGWFFKTAASPVRVDTEDRLEGVHHIDGAFAKTSKTPVERKTRVQKDWEKIGT